MVLRVPGVSPELSHEGFGHQGPPEVSSLHPVSRAPPVPNYGRKRGGPSPDHEVLSRAEPGAQGDLACRISGVGRVTKVAVVVVYVVVEAVTRQGNGPRDPLKRQNAEPRGPSNPVKRGRNRYVSVVVTRDKRPKGGPWGSTDRNGALEG